MVLVSAHCLRMLYISRIENEKGLCTYILYMHIAPIHSQHSIYIMFGEVLKL